MTIFMYYIYKLNINMLLFVVCIPLNLPCLTFINIIYPMEGECMTFFFLGGGLWILGFFTYIETCCLLWLISTTKNAMNSQGASPIIYCFPKLIMASLIYKKGLSLRI